MQAVAGSLRPMEKLRSQIIVLQRPRHARTAICVDGQRERRSHLRRRYQIIQLPDQLVGGGTPAGIPKQKATRTGARRGAQTVDGEVVFDWSMNPNLADFPCARTKPPPASTRLVPGETTHFLAATALARRRHRHPADAPDCPSHDSATVQSNRVSARKTDARVLAQSDASCDRSSAQGLPPSALNEALNCLCLVIGVTFHQKEPTTFPGQVPSPLAISTSAILRVATDWLRLAPHRSRLIGRPSPRWVEKLRSVNVIAQNQRSVWPGRS